METVNMAGFKIVLMVTLLGIMPAVVTATHLPTSGDGPDPNNQDQVQLSWNSGISLTANPTTHFLGQTFTQGDGMHFLNSIEIRWFSYPEPDLTETGDGTYPVTADMEIHNFTGQTYDETSLIYKTTATSNGPWIFGDPGTFMSWDFGSVRLIPGGLYAFIVKFTDGVFGPAINNLPGVNAGPDYEGGVLLNNFGSGDNYGQQTIQDLTFVTHSSATDPADLPADPTCFDPNAYVLGVPACYTTVNDPNDLNTACKGDIDQQNVSTMPLPVGSVATSIGFEGINFNRWVAQSFTPTFNYLSGIDWGTLEADETINTLPDGTILETRIYENAGGVPGALLASTQMQTPIADAGAPTFKMSYRFNLATPLDVSSYVAAEESLIIALVVPNAAAGDLGIVFSPGSADPDPNANYYEPGISYESLNQGASWEARGDKDQVFRTYGFEPPIVPLPGDLDDDCRVDYRDYATIADQWGLDCTNPGPSFPDCNGADLDGSGDVGLPDLKIAADNWLRAAP